MALKLASLFIKLGADTVDVEKGFKKTKKGAKNWQYQMESAGLRVNKAVRNTGIAATASAVAFAAMYRSTANDIDKLAKTSAKLGIAVDELQAFRFAGEKAGVEVATLDKALLQSAKAVSEAAQGMGIGRDAIKQLGLNAKELAEQSPDKIFTTLLNEIQKVPSSTDRVRIAFQLFGARGVGALNLTSEAIAEARDDLDKLGVTLTGIDASGVEAANDAIADLGLISKGIRNRIVTNLSTPINNFATTLFESAKQGQQLDDVIKGFTDAATDGFAGLLRMTAGALDFIDNNTSLAQGGIIGYLLLGKKGILIGSLIGAARDGAKSIYRDMQIAFGDGGTELEKLDLKLRQTRKRIDNANKSARRKGFSRSDDVTELEQQAKELEIQIDSLRTRTGEFGSTTAKTETNVGKFADTLRTLADAAQAPLIVPLAESDDLSGPALLSIQEIKDAEIAAAEEVKQAKLAAEQAVFDAKEAFAQDARDRFSDSRASDAAANEAQAAKDSFADVLFNAQQFQAKWTNWSKLGASQRYQVLYAETKDSLAVLGQHSRKFFEANKAAGLGNAVINVAEGITAALKLPFPANIAAAAKTALLGAAQISTITNAKFGAAAPPSVSASGGSVATPQFPQAQAGDTVGVNATAEAGAKTQFNFTVVKPDGLIDNDKFGELVMSQVTKSIDDKSLLLELDGDEIKAQMNAA